MFISMLYNNIETLMQFAKIQELEFHNFVSDNDQISRKLKRKIFIYIWKKSCVILKIKN